MGGNLGGGGDEAQGVQCERAYMLRALVNEQGIEKENVCSPMSSEVAPALFGRPEENTAAGIAE